MSNVETGKQLKDELSSALECIVNDNVFGGGGGGGRVVFVHLMLTL